MDSNEAVRLAGEASGTVNDNKQGRYFIRDGRRLPYYGINQSPDYAFLMALRQIKPDHHLVTQEGRGPMMWDEQSARWDAVLLNAAAAVKAGAMPRSQLEQLERDRGSGASAPVETFQVPVARALVPTMPVLKIDTPVLVNPVMPVLKPAEPSRTFHAETANMGLLDSLKSIGGALLGGLTGGGRGLSPVGPLAGQSPPISPTYTGTGPGPDMGDVQGLLAQLRARYPAPTGPQAAQPLQAGLPIGAIARGAGKALGVAMAGKEVIDLARGLGGGSNLMLGGVKPDEESVKIRRCPQGYALAIDGNCYPKAMLPKQFRMHKPEPKPVVSRSDQKAIRRADGARKRLVKITRDAGAHASMSKPRPCGCGPKGRKK